MGESMGWILVFIFIAVAVAALVGGSVLHPVLYGLFIAAVLVIPIWIVYCVIQGLFDGIFGKRR